jgi:hypothetical protein
MVLRDCLQSDTFSTPEKGTTLAYVSLQEGEKGRGVLTIIELNSATLAVMIMDIARAEISQSGHLVS